MQISVRPGKKEGFPKTIFDRPVDTDDVDLDVDDDGNVIMTIVADDIYAPKSTRRYSIKLDEEDLEAILRASSRRPPGGAARHWTT